MLGEKNAIQRVAQSISAKLQMHQPHQRPLQGGNLAARLFQSDTRRERAQSSATLNRGKQWKISLRLTTGGRAPIGNSLEATGLEDSRLQHAGIQLEERKTRPVHMSQARFLAAGRNDSTAFLISPAKC